ncbi:hypothetical protein CF67_15010 (plasmid) [Candidatus Photodesmus blepharus]|uniref:GP-PDE domain-containing protein n=1 Tax=Candidatus Photodesmus blepharonis TaxID=1179155 RepID=A0A084CNW6_9GAMM|nr:hypothetical protein [Candidatus Photodesmus blepharus]KEY91495.1 hypothetical protein CF67_15010 [Candidatus Photodesmus blepharus]
MTLFIAHRINDSYSLSSIKSNFGVELDLRDSSHDVILSHDPFTMNSFIFKDFLSCYKHKTIILNIKSEGIEYRVIQLLKKYSIHDYFFLDSSFPMMESLSKIKEKKIAVRFSEYEPIEFINAARRIASWVWVDCFTKFPLDKRTFDFFKSIGLKVCVVSPELQDQPEKIRLYAHYMVKNGIQPDAICSKVHNYVLWSEYFNFE